MAAELKEKTKEQETLSEIEETEDEDKPEKKSHFLWIKNFLPTRQKREEAFQKSREAILRKDIEEGDIAELSEKEKAEVREAVERAEKEGIREGVDMGELDVPTLLKAYLENKIVEIETFSPYLIDHDVKHGNFIGLTNDELIGLELGQHLKKQFPRAKTIALYDEYNNDLVDSSSPTGAPTALGPMLSFSEEAKAKFRENTINRLKEYGIISEKEKEDEDYFIVSESSKIADAEKLVESLDAEGFIKREGDEIWFIKQDSENPIYRKILLRSKKGKWQCEALDASAFLDKTNRERCHLVVLPKSYKEQQGKVWEILRTLKFKPENYHNIYFDEGLDPSHVVETVKQRIQEGRDSLFEDNESEFEVEEYVDRNYGKKLFAADRRLIVESLASLKKLGLEVGSLEEIADIGTGPNFYPPMMMSPFVSQKGKIDLIEYSPSNRRYLNEMVTGEFLEYNALSKVWGKFDKLMGAAGGKAWDGSIDQARKHSNILAGSTYDLPKEKYDLVSSFFCSESITEKMPDFEDAVHCLLDSVKPGGYVVVAHMLDEIVGYPAGERTHFPSIILSIEDIERTYAGRADVEIKVITEEEKTREGYSGMALVVGKKK